MRKIKRMIAALAAMTIVFGMFNTAAYASRTYDINDADYQQRVDSMGDNIYREEDLVKIRNKYEEEKTIGFDDGDGNVKQYKGLDITKHIYSSGKVSETDEGSLCSGIDLEYESYYLSDISFKYRYFSQGIIYWNKLSKKQLEKYTVDELNSFLKENDLKAHFEDYEIKYDSTKQADIIDVCIALNEKFDISLPEMLIDMGSGKNYIVPSENQSKATLKGDADLNGVVELADLIAVAKYSLSHEAYPLANDTAFANADMNGDGVVDGLDVSALIESQLGKEYVTPAETGKTVELTADIKPYSIQSSKPSTKFENSQIDFSLSLLKNTLSEEGNTLISGYSAAQALAMTANGAQNNTLKEMMNVIGGGMDIGSFNDNMAGFNSNQPNDESCKLLTANSIWYQGDENVFRADKDFLVKNKSYYDAQIYAAPMDSSTVNDINSWVSAHTDKMIPEIIDELDEGTIMALVNAVTFDAKWSVPFEEARRSSGFFTSADGSEQDAEVLTELDHLTVLKDIDATGFLKYYKGGRYAFAAVLPNEGTSLNDYVKGLTADKFTALLENKKNVVVDAQMPKFTVDFDAELNKPLADMGIKDAFSPENADFGKMGKAGNNLYISDVIQKTHIDVDEDGTKAAAATAIAVCTTCALPVPEETIILNRPFLYAIVDTQTNIPIFMGTLNTLK